MPAANWPIIIEEGSQFDLYVTLYDSECVAKSLAGCGARMQVRAERDEESTILYDAEVSSGITIEPDGVTGLLHIQLSVVVVNAPGESWTKGWWDLLVWPAGGSITSGAKRHIEGRATWSPAVTQLPVVP